MAAGISYQLDACHTVFWKWDEILKEPVSACLVGLEYFHHLIS